MRAVKFLLMATLSWLALALAGCAGSTGPGPLFTPVTQATLDAYQYGQPVTSADQAVVAAFMALGTTRIHFAALPWPVSIESMTYAQARQRLDRPGENYYDPRPDSLAVWLVVFEATTRSSRLWPSRLRARKDAGARMR